MKLSQSNFYPVVEKSSDWRERKASMIGHALRAVLRILALTLYGVLELLEGLVCPLLAGLSVLIALTAFIFEGTKLPHSPFWTLMGASIGCALAMVLYHLLMRFLRFITAR